MNELLEKRRGNTGIWTYVLRTGNGTIIGLSAWGTNYEFTEDAWNAMPLVKNCLVASIL